MDASRSTQGGQAMVEYIVGTLFVVLAVALLSNTSVFSVGRDILDAVKNYFKAFAYAISVAAT